MSEQVSNAIRQKAIRNEKDISNLKTTVFGDGNGNKGLVRRTDGLEFKYGYLVKQNWAIILLLFANLVKMFWVA